MRLPIAILVILYAHVFCSQGALGTRIEEILSAQEFKESHWGILVVDVEWGKEFYAHNPDKLFAPASVTKLFSVAAGLEALGADYCFETPIYRRGDLDSSGRLKGDLIAVASGDLTMGGRTDSEGRLVFKNSDHTYANGNCTAELTEPDPLAGLNELAQQVADSGIKEVTGDVMIDDRLFETAQGTGSGPSRLTPILINDNLIDLLITPTEPSQLAKVEWRPKTISWSTDAQVHTVSSNQELRIQIHAPSSGRIIVRGQIPAGHKPLVRVHEVDDPASFARALLIEALGRASVAVKASPFGSNDRQALPAAGAYSGLTRVAALKSPPFRESAKLILKVSHNLHASTLPLVIAARQGKRTLADGLQRQKEFLRQIGVDVEAISFGGGAGGSRADYVTPRATVQLLRAMASRPDFPAFEAGLPVLGADGTLAKAVTAQSPARGKVRAKTGTLFWDNTMNKSYVLTSKALAGYIHTGRGRHLSFAIFVNNALLEEEEEIGQIGRTLGRLCELFYEEL